MLELFVLIISIIGNVSLGMFAYRANPKSRTNQLFLLLIIVTVIWLIPNYLNRLLGTRLSEIPNAEHLALINARAVIVFAAAQIFSLFLFVHTFPSTTIQLKPKYLYLSSGYTLLVMLVAASPFLFTGIDGMTPVPNPVPGPGIIAFLILVVTIFSGTLVLLIKKTLHASGLMRRQLSLLSSGIITTFGLIALSNFVIVIAFKDTTFMIFTPAYTLILAGSIAYAMVAHHLFDIRVIIKRTVVYSGLLLFAVLAYSTIVFFFAAIFGSGFELLFDTKRIAADFIAAAMIAAGFDPLRKWLVAKTDKYLFVGEYNAQEVTADLASKLNSVTDLDEALREMMNVVTKAVRANKAATFILALSKEEGLSVKRTESIGYKTTAQFKLTTDDPLVKHFSDPKHMLMVADELRLNVEREKEKHPACEKELARLQEFEAEVALAMRVGDKLIGIFLIGPKLSGSSYSDTDLQFLDIAAKQTASSIEKSRLYEDDQLKSEFVSIASHELLTPTAAIEGYLSMILDEKMAKVDPKAEEYLRKVQISAKRLAELVTDLLSVSRIESGKIVVNKVPLDPTPVLQSAIDEIKVRVDQSGLTLKYIAPPKPLPKVLADADRLTQVIINLISNAIKYNKPKGIIEVSTEVDKKFVTFSVKDSGIGIAPNHLEHLFEKFYRVQDDSAAAEKIGTGLGLYITRNIIELQGGKIWVKSESGKGSTFNFTLPLA